jgi:hypothetical protein
MLANIGLWGATKALASATIVPVSEYLSITYRPDCDCIDREVQERNLGEREHALLQGIFTAIFCNHPNVFAEFDEIQTPR